MAASATRYCFGDTGDCPPPILIAANSFVFCGPGDRITYKWKTRAPGSTLYAAQRRLEWQLPRGWHACVRPTGAFYCFPSIGAHLGKPLGAKKAVCGEAVAFCTAVLEEAHVALVPGNDFGFPDHVRLSFATSMGNIDKGLDRMEKFLKGA